MVKTIMQSEIKEFYENSIEKRINAKEGLIRLVTPEFKQILAEYSKGIALDLGYGYGNYTIALAKKGLEVVAIDYIERKFLKKRINDKKYQNKISILKKDIDYFSPKQSFDVIVAKDVLHFLSKYALLSIMKKLSSKTKINGTNYIVLFTDIQRQFLNGERIIIEGEANISKQELVKYVKEIYSGWNVRIISKKYEENTHSGLDRRFNFKANKITIIARKIRSSGRTL
jgi:2-polyprenyl-3-methyl-5-hydroxy-6-metoxy-1,4-benzoquinol methylase